LGTKKAVNTKALGEQFFIINKLKELNKNARLDLVRNLSNFSLTVAIKPM
jgi:hypothetical protein